MELINHPFAPKKYREISRYYEEHGKINDSNAFLLALQTKFDVSNNTHPDEKQ